MCLDRTLFPRMTPGYVSIQMRQVDLSFSFSFNLIFLFLFLDSSFDLTPGYRIQVTDEKCEYDEEVEYYQPSEC